MKTLSITITGETTDDLVVGLQEVFKLVGDDYTTGFNTGEARSYHFDVDEGNLCLPA